MASAIGFNRSMLARIAGENNAGIPLSGQSKQRQHLTPAKLASLIHHDYGPFRQFPLGEKAGNRSRRRKARLLHVHDLLALRGKNGNRSPSQTKLPDKFMEDEALSCSGAAAKNRNEICGSEQPFERLALLVVELLIHGLRICHQRPAVSDTFLRGLNDFPFPHQHVAFGHFAWTLRIADVATLFRMLLEFGNGKILPTRPAQRLLPHMAFQHNGVPVK